MYDLAADSDGRSGEVNLPVAWRAPRREIDMESPEFRMHPKTGVQARRFRLSEAPDPGSQNEFERVSELEASYSALDQHKVPKSACDRFKYASQGAAMFVFFVFVAGAFRIANSPSIADHLASLGGNGAPAALALPSDELGVAEGATVEESKMFDAEVFREHPPPTPDPMAHGLTQEPMMPVEDRGRYLRERAEENHQFVGDQGKRRRDGQLLPGDEDERWFNQEKPAHEPGRQLGQEERAPDRGDHRQDEAMLLQGTNTRLVYRKVAAEGQEETAPEDGEQGRFRKNVALLLGGEEEKLFTHDPMSALGDKGRQANHEEAETCASATQWCWSYDECVQTVEKMQELGFIQDLSDPTNPAWVLNLIAMCFERENDLEKAHLYFQLAVDKEPENAWFASNLGAILLRKSDRHGSEFASELRMAEEYLHVARALAQTHPPALAQDAKDLQDHLEFNTYAIVSRGKPHLEVVAPHFAFVHPPDPLSGANTRPEITGS